MDRQGADAVLVVETLEGPAPSRRFRRRPRRADPGAPPPTVPLTRLTAVPPDRLDDANAANEWLQRLARDTDLAEEELRKAIVVVNRAIHAQRIAARDPFVADLSADRALAVRIGWGTGDEVADSRWREAIELPLQRRGRRPRTDEVGPQEQVAAVLAGREQVEPAASMLLRARADLQAGLLREAALQLDAARAALAAGGEAPSEESLRARLRDLQRELRQKGK